MKILWLSNIVLTEYDRGGTGTWLSAMAESLLNIDYLNLGKYQLRACYKGDTLRL